MHIIRENLQEHTKNIINLMVFLYFSFLKQKALGFQCFLCLDSVFQQRENKYFDFRHFFLIFTHKMPLPRARSRYARLDLSEEGRIRPAPPAKTSKCTIRNHSPPRRRQGGWEEGWRVGWAGLGCQARLVG